MDRAAYYEALADGEREYRDAINRLAAEGFSSAMTQTGGMCAALHVRLERGILLITDAGDELPWRRNEQRGWGVGYYPSDDASDGPAGYAETESSDVESLIGVVRDCLLDAHRSMRGM